MGIATAAPKILQQTSKYFNSSFKEIPSLPDLITSPPNTAPTSTDTQFPQQRQLPLPLPENSKCFQLGRGEPECAKFYRDECNQHACWKIMACPIVHNPVHDSDGIVYPSACWAEQLGVMNYQYGYSRRLPIFISNLWRKHGYEVPFPDVAFSYGLDSAPTLTSFLWKNSTQATILEYFISTNSSLITNIDKVYPVYGRTVRALLIFINFDEVYPEYTLINWTKKFEAAENEKMIKMQEVDNPLQYDITPVVINPPEGIERPIPQISYQYYYSNDDIEKIYSAAVNKINQSNFQMLILSPIFILERRAGGYASFWKNMSFAYSPLAIGGNYNFTSDKKELLLFLEFYGMFGLFSHEASHASFGLHDTFLSYENQLYLTFEGQNIDPFTGKKEGEYRNCEFFKHSPDYFAIELPDDLKIYADERPSWLEADSSSSCSFRLNDIKFYLYDLDNDNEYELMFSGQIFATQVRRMAGWVDIDSDGVAEIADYSPYGGYRELFS
ncbi:MAG: hypothetical protein HYW25_00380 [Candidatus Aenigmarchaeota archaeon]|nr:hypothetical protein [Candidatus Aenigmarchaeota archaeon]